MMLHNDANDDLHDLDDHDDKVHDVDDDDGV